MVYNGECGVRVNGHVEDDIPNNTDGQGAVMVVLWWCHCGVMVLA